MEYEVSKLPLPYKSYALVVLFLSSLTLYMFYVQSYVQLKQNYFLNAIEFSRNKVSEFWKPTDYCNSSEFLVCSSKCKIPNLDPFNSDLTNLYHPQPYHKCNKLPLLTYTKVTDNIATLYINRSQILNYSDNGVNCCVKYVERVQDNHKPDSTNKISSCVKFENDIKLKHDIAVVECKDKYSNKTVYKNIHNVITINKDVKSKLTSSNSSDHLSILAIGIDSVSRLNFMRLMKKTQKFIRENDWIELSGYNKIADNTFPNLMAIFTGMNESEAYKICNPKKLGYLDKCNIILYDFKRFNFVTSYAEDEPRISTFNYFKQGFVKPPTDYYFRPYVLALEKELKTTWVDEMKYCTGPESSGERILNLAKEFAKTFQNDPYFGFFWMNSFSHNLLNALSRMDEKVDDFLRELFDSQVLNNTIVIVFSDHGLRFGDILLTRTGWLEERLPMFFVSFPKWFNETYPDKYQNFKINSKRLTTPYDVYMTLQDLIVMSGKNYTIVPSSGCPNCRSLFEQVDLQRSCEDAFIEQHWCTCNGYRPISGNNLLVRNATKYILDKIERIKSVDHNTTQKCATFNLNKVISASISENSPNWYKNNTYLLIIFKTIPAAVFEATVSSKLVSDKFKFNLEGTISRIDSYQSHSGCVHNSNLAKYCYCVR